RLDDRDGGRSAEPECERCRTKHEQAVAPHELARPIPPGARARHDRKAIEVMANVLSELLDGGVPLRGLLRESLQCDVVEVTRELLAMARRPCRHYLEDEAHRV